jgi:SAM-dependent methyltransferase
MKLLSYVERVIDLTEWRELRLSKQSCPLCQFPYLVKLGSSAHAIRCMHCGANPTVMSLVKVLLSCVPDLATKSVYELSSRGPLFRFLKSHAGKLTFSEYFDDVAPGDEKKKVQCQDVQNLTFPDQSFDVCTSTDVFEHVPEDAKGFSEIYRVLRPGGCTVFTVPLHQNQKTIERAKVHNGHIAHLLSPEYHGDHIRGLNQVLCFRNYGTDIVDRLCAQGFTNAEIITPDTSLWWGCGRNVVIAYR